MLRRLLRTCFGTGSRFACLMLMAPVAFAQVTVSTAGNQAFAHIELPEGVGSYVADVTITFDSPANLSPAELNLTASVVNPSDPGLLTQLSTCTPACAVDPAFPKYPALPVVACRGFEPVDPDGARSTTRQARPAC